jgi:hypothetical protein
MALYKEQGRICRELGNISSLGISLAKNALLLSKMGKHKEALPLAEEAVELFKKANPAKVAQGQEILDYIRRKL